MLWSHGARTLPSHTCTIVASIDWRGLCFFRYGRRYRPFRLTTQYHIHSSSKNRRHVTSMPRTVRRGWIGKIITTCAAHRKITLLPCSRCLCRLSVLLVASSTRNECARVSCLCLRFVVLPPSAASGYCFDCLPLLVVLSCIIYHPVCSPAVPVQVTQSSLCIMIMLLYYILLFSFFALLSSLCPPHPQPPSRGSLRKIFPPTNKHHLNKQSTASYYLYCCCCTTHYF